MRNYTVKSIKPRPQDDEAIAEFCRWLKQNKLIALTQLSGRLIIMPKGDVDDRDYVKKGITGQI
jgi:hypothetical protein